MTKHTKGPWQAEAREEGLPTDIIGPPETLHIRIAQTLTGLPDDHANARLIAEAPSLLEALEIIVTVAREAIDKAKT